MPAERRTPEQTFVSMFDTLIDGQRKVMTLLGQLGTRVSENSAEMVKFSRNQIQMRSDIGELRADVAYLRSEMDRRFDAVNESMNRRFDAAGDSVDRRFVAMEVRLDALLARMQEIEQSLDSVSTEIRDLKIELITQYNKVLNAIQSGERSLLDIEEIHARLDELERRAGLK